MTFLTSASGLVDAARGGPVKAQAADVVELLTDPERCQVALVTLPEEMPVNEVIDAAYQLEDRVGVSLGPVIVNACYPTVEGLEVPAAVAAVAAGVTLDPRPGGGPRRRQRVPADPPGAPGQQIDRLAHDLPLPQLQVPFVFSESIGPDQLRVLADALAAGVAALPDPVRA